MSQGTYSPPSLPTPGASALLLRCAPHAAARRTQQARTAAQRVSAVSCGRAHAHVCQWQVLECCAAHFNHLESAYVTAMSEASKKGEMHCTGARACARSSALPCVSTECKHEVRAPNLAHTCARTRCSWHCGQDGQPEGSWRQSGRVRCCCTCGSTPLRCHGCLDLDFARWPRAHMAAS